MNLLICCKSRSILRISSFNPLNKPIIACFLCYLVLSELFAFTYQVHPLRGLNDSARFCPNIAGVVGTLSIVGDVLCFRDGRLRFTLSSGHSFLFLLSKFRMSQAVIIVQNVYVRRIVNRHLLHGVVHLRGNCAVAFIEDGTFDQNFRNCLLR